MGEVLKSELDFDYLQIDKNQIISVNIEQYGHEPIYNVTFRGAPVKVKRNVIHNSTQNVTINTDGINIKERNERNMELLKLYKENELSKIERKCDEKMDELLAKDKFVIKAREYNKFIEENTDKLYETIDDERILEETTIKEKDKIIDKMKLEKRKLNDLIDMLECHLELAQTFEEKQNLLKLYGIVNEEGKLKTFIDDEEEINYEEIVERKVKKCKK